MFRDLSAHLQEDTVVYMQHMVLSLSTRVRGGLSVHSLSENWLEGEQQPTNFHLHPSDKISMKLNTRKPEQCVVMALLRRVWCQGVIIM